MILKYIDFINEDSFGFDGQFFDDKFKEFINLSKII